MNPLFLLKRHRMVLRLFCALVLIGCGYHARGQYHSFFADSITEYSVCGGCVGYQDDSDPFLLGCHSYDFALLNSDTVNIQDQNYFVILNPDPYSFQGVPDELYIYLREDTLNGRIYRYDALYDREVVTCDMSLSVGDTFWLPYSISYYGLNPQHGTNTRPVPIIADSVWFLNGLKYIQFARVEEPSESYLDFLGPIMFIESIGPNYSPFGWCNGMMECHGSCYRDGIYKRGPEPLLLCMHKNEELVYMVEERAGCFQIAANVQEEEPFPWRVYPNPVRNHLTIKIDHEIMDGFLWITDLYGRVLHAQPIRENTFRLNIGQYSSGTYIVTIRSDNKLFSQKIVKK